MQLLTSLILVQISKVGIEARRNGPLLPDHSLPPLLHEGQHGWLVPLVVLLDLLHEGQVGDVQDVCGWLEALWQVAPNCPVLLLLGSGLRLLLNLQEQRAEFQKHAVAGLAAPSTCEAAGRAVAGEGCCCDLCSCTSGKADLCGVPPTMVLSQHPLPAGRHRSRLDPARNQMRPLAVVSVTQALH